MFFLLFGIKKMEKGVVKRLFSYKLEEKLGFVVHNKCIRKRCFLKQGHGIAVVADARGVVGVASEDDGCVVFLA